MNLVMGVKWPGLAALLCVALLACDGGRSADGGTFGSSVIAMDHDPSDTFVGRVIVDGYWVGEASTGGGVVLGGISLPRQWAPGVTAIIRWQRCKRFEVDKPIVEEDQCEWREKVVPIHPYEYVGGTHLHIMEDDQVLIIPSMLAPNSSRYPGPGYPDKNFFRRGGDV